MNKLLTILTITAVLTAGTLAFRSIGPSHPTSDKELAATTAMITNFAGNSGGTGVVLTSNATESTVLTNKHVCAVVEYGGLVSTDNHRATVTSYRESEVHDICLITVNTNLEANTELATNSPDLYTAAIAVGHPQLLNTIVTRGHFSGKEVFDIMIGMRACTEEDQKNGFGMLCAILGGFPIIKTYQAQVISATIQPGSSGSAVFNDAGKIAGLVFAGSDPLCYGHIVPLEYLQNFIKNEIPDLIPKTPKDNSEQKVRAMMGGSQKLREVCKNTTNTLEYEVVKDYCKYVNTDLIYTK